MPTENTETLELPRSEALPTSPQGRGVWIRLVNDVLALAGPHAELLSHSERPWSSVTFAGTRHTIALAFRGADAATQFEAYRRTLPDHEFAIPRHLVADATVSLIEREASAGTMIAHTELLVLEDV